MVQKKPPKNQKKNQKNKLMGACVTTFKTKITKITVSISKCKHPPPNPLKAEIFGKTLKFIMVIK